MMIPNFRTDRSGKQCGQDHIVPRGAVCSGSTLFAFKAFCMLSFGQSFIEKSICLSLRKSKDNILDEQSYVRFHYLPRPVCHKLRFIMAAIPLGSVCSNSMIHCLLLY